MSSLICKYCFPSNTYLFMSVYHLDKGRGESDLKVTVVEWVNFQLKNSGSRGILLNGFSFIVISGQMCLVTYGIFVFSEFSNPVTCENIHQSTNTNLQSCQLLQSLSQNQKSSGKRSKLCTIIFIFFCFLNHNLFKDV